MKCRRKKEEGGLGAFGPTANTVCRELWAAIALDGRSVGPAAPESPGEAACCGASMEDALIKERWVP